MHAFQDTLAELLKLYQEKHVADLDPQEIYPLLQRLAEQLGVLNAQEEKKKPESYRDITKAPKALISLKDLAVLQTSVEVCICWDLLPLLPSSIYRPVAQRLQRKTLQRKYSYENDISHQRP